MLGHDITPINVGNTDGFARVLHSRENTPIMRPATCDMHHGHRTTSPLDLTTRPHHTTSAQDFDTHMDAGSLIRVPHVTDSLTPFPHTEVHREGRNRHTKDHPAEEIGQLAPAGTDGKIPRR